MNHSDQTGADMFQIPGESPASPADGRGKAKNFLSRVSNLNGGLLTTEVSYLDGKVVLRATPGSIRMDLVAGHPAAPVRAYLLKTRRRQTNPFHVQAIRGHLPGCGFVPILSLHP